MFVFGCFWLSGCGALFFLIVWFDWLFRLAVFLIDFAVDWWGLVWKKKNKGLTVHWKLPLLNHMSKWVRSDSRFKRLIFWFGRVLFVVKRLLCYERRFANDEKVKSFAKQWRILFLCWRKRSRLFGLVLIAWILWRKR